MREFVLNDACLGVNALTVEDAAVLAADVERGVSALLAARHALSSMRLAASIGEISISPGVTLADVLTHLIRSTTGSGRLLTRLATKFPVENDLEDDDFAALVDWSIPAHPQSLALVLCACSGRIAATLSKDAVWMVDPLQLAVVTNPATPGMATTVEVDNVYSAASAAELANRLTAALINAAKPADLWRDRAQFYPHLDFAPRVEGDLAALGAMEYDAAVSRLRELNTAVSGWKAGEASPPYLSKVTGESAKTMNRYGKYRIFRSAAGTDETFELHARLAGGFRLHLREIFATRRVEVGYIGPHLPIASEN